MKKALMMIVLAAFLVPMLGCEKKEGALEEAREKAEEAAKDTKDAVKDAAKETKDAVKDATN